MVGEVSVTAEEEQRHAQVEIVREGDARSRQIAALPDKQGPPYLGLPRPVSNRRPRPTGPLSSSGGRI